ncbi:MAG TPA: hypothetical protein VJP80_06275 [Candidatus Saccharimonadales bacterium]|nr:hypothetical protein [Candidatus Saccharimonadales bacterium]
MPEKGALHAARATMVVTYVVAAVAAMAAALAPVPRSWQYSHALYYEGLILVSAYMCLLIGAVVLLLMGAGAYKAELKRAYLAMCAGIMLVALGCVQLPVLGIFNLWGSAWVNNGFVGVPFFVSGLVLYIGVRRLALLIGQAGLLTRFVVVVPLVIVLCVALAFVPHVHVTFAERDFDIAYGIFMWSAVFTVIATVLLARIQRDIGQHYQSAMAWLCSGVGNVAVALILVIVGGFVSNKTQDNWSIAIDVAGLAAGLTLVHAGYVFTKTKEY